MATSDKNVNSNTAFTTHSSLGYASVQYSHRHAKPQPPIPLQNHDVIQRSKETHHQHRKISFLVSGTRYIANFRHRLKAFSPFLPKCAPNECFIPQDGAVPKSASIIAYVSKARALDSILILRLRDSFKSVNLRPRGKTLVML